jgi:large subunit ribosomal protein L3
MGGIHRPRRGSLAFSPRKRAKKQVPTIKTWPKSEETRLQGFAGYKAGMTHVIAVDTIPGSMTEGMELALPVTVIETPPLRVIGIRGYERTTYGLRALSEIWTNEMYEELSRVVRIPKKPGDIGHLTRLIEEGRVSELRAIVATRPSLVTGVPKKKPEIMEMGVGGTDVSAKLSFLEQLLGKDVSIGDVYSEGQFVDVVAVTKGKGTQGPVKRWGIQLQKTKHKRSGKLRHIGNLGPWNPHHVRWTVPQAGQMGYFRRTEFNKMIVKIGDNGEEITPAGGFLHYGVVRNSYVLLKGSVPGPTKRLIRLRDPIRLPAKVPSKPEVVYVSLESKQGV